MDDIEVAIIKVLKKGIPVRARRIATAIGSTRKEVNQYLYTSLRELVSRDIYYRWSLKNKFTIENHNSLSEISEEENHCLEELIQEHQYKRRSEELERALESLIRSKDN